MCLLYHIPEVSKVHRGAKDHCKALHCCLRKGHCFLKWFANKVELEFILCSCGIFLPSANAFLYVSDLICTINSCSLVSVPPIDPYLNGLVFDNNSSTIPRGEETNKSQGEGVWPLKPPLIVGLTFLLYEVLGLYFSFSNFPFSNFPFSNFSNFPFVVLLRLFPTRRCHISELGIGVEAKFLELQ